MLACELYRRVLAVESPDWTPADDAVDTAFWGPLADTVAEQYAQKQQRVTAAMAALARPAAWDNLRAALAPMLRTPESLHACLSGARAATRAEHIGITPQRLTAVFLRCHQMRPRFTVLDLARLVGVMPGAAADIVRQWA